MKWLFLIISTTLTLRDWFGRPSDELHTLFRLAVLLLSLAAFCILDKQDNIVKAIAKHNAALAQKQ